MIDVIEGTEVPMVDVLASCVTIGIDPSLFRVEADERCDRCGHRADLHDADKASQLAPGLTCLYHDSEGPCLCTVKP